MKVKMLVAGNPLEYDIHEQLYFDPENVFDELDTQPGKVAWWYSLVALKEQEVEDFSMRVAAETANAELAFRADADNLAKQYGKVTEGVISSLVQTAPVVTDLKTKYNELRRELMLLKAMTRGFEARTTLMTTSASARKEEMKAHLATNIKNIRKVENESK